ncbi:MAG: hypothetical protein ACI92G_001405 [Candidatus Pelagisphaera sp.]|mgnify:CR=1 FL=1|jgi:hypothetical protein
MKLQTYIILGCLSFAALGAEESNTVFILSDVIG